MKTKPVEAFLGLLILMCAGLLLIIRYSKYGKEGFADNSEDRAPYEALRTNIKNVLTPYCQIANLVQDQMMQAYMTSKVETPLPTPPPKAIAEPKFEASETADKASESKGWWGDSAPAAADAKAEEPSALTPPGTELSKIGVAPAPAKTREEAWKDLMQTYQNVYNCTDDLSKLRPQCGVGGLLLIPTPHPDWKYIPCTSYNLPAYNTADDSDMIIALMKIPDHTAEKLSMEVTWYSSVINKLQEGLDKGNTGMGETPPSIPANPEMPKEDGQDKRPDPPQPNPTIPGPSAKAMEAQNKLLSARGFNPLGSKKEGFYAAGQCSLEAMALKRKAMALKKQKQLEADANSCTMPTLKSEIDRVNGILNSKAFLDTMNLSRKVFTAAMKLQSDLEKLKAGTLYDWQKSGPKKSYTQFKGGDRTAAFIASASQNKDFSYSG
jgi:hypothetical protein